MIQRNRKFRFADLFCGAGGFTAGAVASGYATGALAINHWRPAISTHRQNYPDVRHICATIDHVDPRDFDGDGINLLLASPECVYHSVARGGRPVDDQRRATAWCVPRWIEAIKPAWVIVENVREFEQWGPLGTNDRPLKSKRGEIFQAWVQAIRALNYHVEWKLLNAADFGGATKRIRLFVVCRRGRSTQPIRWPQPTHSKENWTPAWKIIDWSKPCPSIFGRKRPLAEKTLLRIEAGLRKFCRPELVEPFLVHLRGRSAGESKAVTDPLPTIIATCENHGVVVPFISAFHNGPDGANRNHSPSDPLPTADTQNRFGVVAPFMVPNFGERDGQQPRTHSVDDPEPTVTGHGAGGVVMPFMVDIHNGHRVDTSTGVDDPMQTVLTKPGNSLILPFLLPRQGHFDCHRDKPAKGVGEPLGTVTASHAPAHVVLPFLTTYYGTGGPKPVTEPISTLTTKKRHGLALVETMRELGIVDIGFRMLDVDELAAAQGFAKDYYLHGTKAEQVKQVGNSVHTAVARALVEAIGEAG